MKVLKTSDLHLTENKAEQYKWGFFDWLEKQVIEHNIDRVDILGDITEKKDRFSSELSNGIIECLTRLAAICQVVILKGNHDYVDPSSPFFKFLNHIPNIRFVVDPAIIDGELFLPHARNPSEEWDWEKWAKKLEDFHSINMHQTVSGSRTANDFVLEHGMPINFFGDFEGPVWAGDIHVPQVLHQKKGTYDIEYVGSPYPVYFGDSFEGRVLILDDDGIVEEPHYPCLSRWGIRAKSLEEFYENDIKKGDHVKATLELHPSDFHLWPEIKKKVKKFCDKKGAELFSVEMVGRKVKAGRVRRKKNEEVSKEESTGDTLKRFSNKEKLGDRYFNIAENLVGGE